MAAAQIPPATFILIHVDLYPPQRSAPLAFLAETLGDGKTLGKFRCVVLPLLLPLGRRPASAIGLKGTEASYCRGIDEDCGAMAGGYNCGIRSVSSHQGIYNSADHAEIGTFGSNRHIKQ